MTNKCYSAFLKTNVPYVVKHAKICVHHFWQIMRKNYHLKLSLSMFIPRVSDLRV